MKKTLATSLACLLALTACSSNTPSTNNGGTGDTGNETAERKHSDMSMQLTLRQWITLSKINKRIVCMYLTLLQD